VWQGRRAARKKFRRLAATNATGARAGSVNVFKLWRILVTSQLGRRLMAAMQAHAVTRALNCSNRGKIVIIV